jgi:hypothetical protein
MEEFKVIEFQQARDFSKKLNTTFEFLRQNFKSLGKSILYISGPPVLVGSLLLGSFMGEFLNLSQSLQRGASEFESFSNYFLTASFWIQILLMFVFFLISFVITIATINNYLIIYSEKKSNKIDVQEVWDRVRNTFWAYLGSSVLFFISFVIAYLVLAIPVFILASISGFLVFFGALFLILGLIYLIFSSSLTYFIQLYENKNFFDAMIRSFKLVNNGKWWSTFGLIMILYLIMITVSYVFMIPYYIITLTSTLHTVSTGNPLEISSTTTIITTISFTLYYMVQMLLSTLPNVGIAFQYFNLVELKEARGLMSQIQTIGQPSVDPNRPEENF